MDHCTRVQQQDNYTPVVSLLSARTQGCLLPWFPLRPNRRKEVWDPGTWTRSPNVKETPRSRWPRDARTMRTVARTRSPRPSPTTSITATGSSGPNRTPMLSCWHPNLRSSRPLSLIPQERTTWRTSLSVMGFLWRTHRLQWATGPKNNPKLWKMFFFCCL